MVTPFIQLVKLEYLQLIVLMLAEISCFVYGLALPLSLHWSLTQSKVQLLLILWSKPPFPLSIDTNLSIDIFSLLSAFKMVTKKNSCSATNLSKEEWVLGFVNGCDSVDRVECHEWDQAEQTWQAQLHCAVFMGCTHKGWQRWEAREASGHAKRKLKP